VRSYQAFCRERCLPKEVTLHWYLRVDLDTQIGIRKPVQVHDEEKEVDDEGDSHLCGFVRCGDILGRHNQLFYQVLSFHDFYP